CVACVLLRPVWTNASVSNLPYPAICHSGCSCEPDTLGHSIMVSGSERWDCNFRFQEPAGNSQRKVARGVRGDCRTFYGLSLLRRILVADEAWPYLRRRSRSDPFFTSFRVHRNWASDSSDNVDLNFKTYSN